MSYVEVLCKMLITAMGFWLHCINKRLIVPPVLQRELNGDPCTRIV